MLTLRKSLVWVAAILAIHFFLAQSRITVSISSSSSSSSASSASSASASSSSSSSSTLRGQPNNSHQPPRSLQNVDGTTACADCDTSAGFQCVGRTVQDENCDDCANGQAFWPCDLFNECWCWDTSTPRTAPTSDGETVDEVACSGCGAESDTEECVSNQNSLIPVEDTECANCMTGQSFWPCDDPDLCWCWDNTKPKQPPAPASGLPLATELDPNALNPCEIFTEDMFNNLSPNATFPYTYEGLCKAIDDYNLHHTEKFAGMGTEDQIRAEIAAFLGNTAHESDDFEAAREYLACGDRKEIDGKVYCKPCNHDQYDFVTNNCSVSMVVENAPYNSYCQPMEPPDGCHCDTITQVEEEGELAGYIDASKVFYGRGAIQISWNYNYIRLSYALTGKAETFCDDPEQIALSPEYAWGSGIYFWMENQKEGSTCHKEVLKGDFGGALNNINGGLECPAYKGGWHASAIKMRLNRYCHAASELGMTTIASLDGCKGMADSFVECLADGECPYCEQYPDAASNSTVTDSEIGSDEATEEPSETESTGSEEPSSDVESGVTIMPSPASSMSSDSVPPTKSPSLTAMPSSDVSGSPSMIEASNATDATATPSLTSTLSPSTIDVENTSNTSAIPTSVGNETIVETIEPTALATENSTTLVPTTLAPTGTPSVSLLPSLSPTTLKPTMGPCDGDSCPGEMCRSFYGFCGSGPSYCDENPIWTPECGDKSKVPSPTPTIVMEDVPTMPPVDLDSVFSTDGSTATPSAAMPSKESSFIKPSGGKKPPPSSSKTSSSPTVDGEILTDSPTLSVETDSPTQGTASPTPVPTEIVFSPTDPEATYFCGTDWDDANASCLIRCPSSKSEDCPSDQKCFAFTSCMDKDTDKFELTPDEVTSTDAEPDEVTSTDAEPNEVTSADATTEATNNESCNGKPCPFAGECRSQYGFCGKSFIYCNDMSSWTLEACGLVGSAKNGDPIKCDTKVFECPDGDEVYKDPANACEFFPCPDDEEEESAITSTSFHTPGLSPSQSSPADMPALPKPTLPTISNASPFTNSAAGVSSNTTIDLGKQPVASDSAVMTVVVNSDITDDEDQTSTTESAQNGGSVAPAPSQEPLTPFLAEEWLMSSSILNRGVNYLLWSMVTLSACVLSI